MQRSILLHFYPEYELTIVIESYGKRIIGSSFICKKGHAKMERMEEEINSSLVNDTRATIINKTLFFPG
jgi:hypothetical protein